MSWSKIEGKSTFGLFSKISHEDRYVLTTIKDRVINVKFDAPSAIAYSELFFPINGVIAIYDRATKKLAELPGANDTAYIQSNGIWTPDDKYIIFARAKALPYPDKSSRYESLISDTTITNAFVRRKRDLKFDLYIIPFNDGKGGEAKPIEGASFNGQSNYFPAISPDDKWLVFCESNNYMMIQPDSKLFIVPREGGKAIKLACNFPEMNSWHAWSPNGKWMVFVSKGLSIYTDMFLTHIDNKGHASIPVLLEDSKRPRCAANYPEFINRDPSFTFDMKYEYINTLLIQAAIHEGKIEQARKMVKQYLEQGQTSTPVEYEDLGNIMLKLGDKKEADKYFKLEAQGDSSFYSRF
jgi:Tol biopolymer transport system component